MDRIDIWALKREYPEGMELTHKSLCNTDAIPRNRMNEVAAILNSLEGSKVKVLLVPFSDDVEEVFIRLCYGESQSEELFMDYLNRVIHLMPFIAACAGPAEEKVEPSRLEKLERRMARVEKTLGIEDEKEN